MPVTLTVALARAIHRVAHPMPGDSTLARRVAWALIRNHRMRVRQMIRRQGTGA